jgi:protein Shroom
LFQVESSCTKQSECLKYRLHVEEIDKITSLLLGLSGRLARTENSIAALEVNSPSITKGNIELQEKVN